MFHYSCISEIDLLLALTVGMNTAYAIFVFGTISYPLGSTFSNGFMVIIVLFAAPRTSTLLANTYLLLFIVVDRYYFGSWVLCKFVAIGRTITTVAIVIERSVDVIISIIISIIIFTFVERINGW